MKKVTRQEFAKIAGVNKSTVSRWIKSGRVQVGDDGLIDVLAAKRSLEVSASPFSHHQARGTDLIGLGADDLAVQDVDAGAADGAALSMAMDGADAVALRLKRAMAKEREAKAEQAAIELDKLTGTLVERSEVDFVLTDFGLTIRTLLEAFPDRLSPSLAGCRGDVNALHAALSGAVHDVLNEMAEHMARKSREVLG